MGAGGIVVYDKHSAVGWCADGWGRPAAMETSMRALVRRSGAVSLEDIPSPRVQREDDVLIQVLIAGICRTDVYVARGTLPVSEPRVLGHEFAGLVLEAGPAAGVRPGERVTVIPQLACGVCASCAAHGECIEPLFLGVHADGAFAERIVVPAAAVLRTPATMDLKRAAYVEPVAAALAVLGAPLDRTGRGLVLGDNRIASLIMRILEIHGFSNFVRLSLAEARAETGLFATIIETEASASALAAMFALLQPRGLGVLKSRPAAPTPIDVALAVKKNLRLHAVGYGAFEQAIDLLHGGALDVDDILGPAFALDDFERAFTASEAGDAGKLFFAISTDPAAQGAAAVADLAHA
jgi:threonine dehydrogenase-like Zn-dependent dehydrogenase